MLRAICLTATLALTAGPIWAEVEQPMEAQVTGASQLASDDPELFALFDAIGLYDILDIMAIEGADYAGDLEAEMFPGQGGAAWPAMVAQIYSRDQLIMQFENGLPDGLFSPDERAAIAAFFTSETGQRVIEGELLARREFMDPTVEEAANMIYKEIVESGGSPRLDLLTRFNEINQLVDLNVSGALNSNFAFYRGLVEGDAFDVELPEDMMLAEVWGQEPEIREETTLWLYSYQLVAYDELTDAELQAYIDLSETPAGQALNTALFTAFDVMFEAVNYQLGVAAALFVAGEET